VSSEILNVDTDKLRTAAANHDKAATVVRNYGQFPTEYLDNFVSLYGTVSYGLQKGLVECCTEIATATEKHAQKHESVAAALRVAANDFDDTDQSAGCRIHLSGNPS
jgi:hypothetical protein